jgi:hypothetical protein
MGKPYVTISPEQNAELQRVLVEYTAATQRAASALAGGDLEGFAEEDGRAAVIVRRIKEIQGTAGKSWNA